MNKFSKMTSRTLDARARIVAGFLLIAGVMVLPWGLPLLAAGVVIPFLLWQVRPSFGRIAGTFHAMGWMLLLTVILHGFTTSGHIWWEVPRVGLELTREGVFRGLQFAGRLGAVIVVGVSMSLSTGPLEGFRAFDSLLRPLSKVGIPVGNATLILGLALRFIPTLHEESLQLKRSLKARGWSPGKGVVGRVRAWIPLFIPLLISGLRRGDDLAESIVLRGYAPHAVRTSLHEDKWGWAESGVVFVTLLPYILVVLDSFI